MSNCNTSTRIIYPYYDPGNNVHKSYTGVDLVNAAFESTLIILSNMYDTDELNLKGINSGLLERIEPNYQNKKRYYPYKSKYEGYIKKN